MEDFLNQFATIPKEFIKDFFIIAKENYLDDEIIISFDLVLKWFDIRKDNLKRLLVNNFEKNYDYTIKQIKKNHLNKAGATRFEEILITPDCFKELCMISQAEKAKQARKYFLGMEKLVKRYYETIKESLYKKIGLLETNHYNFYIMLCII